MDFFNKLKEVCKSKKTTPTAVCKELGLSTSLPTKWKNGVAPNLETVKRIADHLGVSVAELLEGKPIAASFHSFTPEEILIIEAYRSASQGIKESVCILLGVKVEQKQTEQKKTDQKKTSVV